MEGEIDKEKRGREEGDGGSIGAGRRWRGAPAWWHGHTGEDQRASGRRKCKAASSFGTMEEEVRMGSSPCLRVLEIWRILGLSSLLQEVCTIERDGSAVLQDLLLSKSSIQSHIADVGRGELIATALWYVWWERRQFTNGEKVFEPPRSAHAISALAKNFYRARGKKSGVLRRGWKPPGAGLYKLNVDACFNIDSGIGSSGIVIRDDKGTFMAALCTDISFADDAGSAEARGLRDGLILANELG
ncbi:retrotransposon expressed [Hordeum vulgare]|nr:retrotransposon expressed [Hordeum vulgare]